MMQITAPHFCAGVVLGTDNIRVVRTAPILRYMLGWTQQRVRAYCASKHWTVEHIALVC
jgi:hypothetical protein